MGFQFHSKMLRLCLFSLPFGVAVSANAGITSYEVAHDLCARGSLYGFRKFSLNGVPKTLVVSTRNLKTKIVDATLLIDCLSQPIAPDSRQNSYFHAVNEYTAVPNDQGNCQTGFKSFPATC